MSADQFIGARVSSDTKERLRALADRQQLSESAMLKRLLDVTLHAADEPGPIRSYANGKALRAARLYVRLQADDQQLLLERATARSMASATYVAVLLRSHLRSLAPLPKDELLALKRTIADLGAVGRNLNQLAKLAHQGNRVGTAPNDFGAMLKICEGLRDHVKALLKANVISWSVGHAEPRK